MGGRHERRSLEDRMREGRRYIERGGGERPHRMLVISWDAVGSEDLAFLETLPHFKHFAERAAGCREVESVCPSLTYPAHVSLITGKLPLHHGVVGNYRLQPGRPDPDWFWQRRFIRGTTLYDEARKAGLRTAALLWPVTGGARIAYNLPEVWANRPWEHQLTVSLGNGTPWYEMDLFRRFGHMIDGIRQPMLDDFVQASLLHTLRSYDPDLTLVHLTDVDTNRHEHGVRSREAQEALRRQDGRLGQVLEAVGELGGEDAYDIILLGDHYQKDVDHVLYPNYHIVQKGWAERRREGLRSWRVAAQSCDGACYIYVKDRKDQELMLQVAQWLREWMRTPGSGVRAVYTRRQARDKGADPRCAFMLEAEDGYYFKNGCIKPMEAVQENAWLHRGAHGYDPKSPGYRTFFLAAGPDFRPGVRVEEMDLTDEGPTLARVLGLELEDADGAVIDELLQDPRPRSR